MKRKILIQKPNIRVHIVQPKTSTLSRYTQVDLGDQLELECLIEAFPKPNSYWSKAAHTSSKQALTRGELSQHRVASTSGAISFDQKTFPELNFMNRNTSSYTKFVGPVQQQSNHQSQASTILIHPHNRIQFRREIDDTDTRLEDRVGRMRKSLSPIEQNSDIDDSRLGTQAIQMIGRQYRTQHEGQNNLLNRLQDSANVRSNESSDSYITVKQTAINPYTYKLKLTIAKMQLDDYGKYSCIATNSLGTHESSVIVTSKLF